MSKRKFKHAPVFSKLRGRWRVQCACGAQTRWLKCTEADIQKVYAEHVGLREKQAKAVMA